MKRFFTITALFLWGAAGAAAQGSEPAASYLPAEGRAPYRTEFISYDIRREADTEMTTGSKYYRALDLRSVDGDYFETTLEISGLWLDRDVYIRDTGRTGRYLLQVNGRTAGYNTDSYGGGEWHVTPLLREGENLFTVQMLAPGTAGADMENFTAPAGRRAIETIYLFSQPRIHVVDYTVSGYHDDFFKDAALDLAVIVRNGFNNPETIRLGYDIWDPTGERKDYYSVDVEIPGRACDTVVLKHKVMGTHRYQYSAENPAQYRVVITLHHGGRNIEYIPLRMGFGLTTYDDSRVSRAGVPIEVRAFEGDFPSRAGALERLRALKRQGFNTIAVTRPQQRWFYDMTAAEGLWVIDRAAVECDPRGDDRTPGGTVANDPAYLARFLDRQAAMFYRRRNLPNVIGWSLGAESGNGFNMYRSYLMLKELDATRPVVYGGAAGEFDTDEY